MSARLPATVCLLCFFGVNVARSEPLSAPGTSLGVYLRTNQNSSGLPTQFMQAELSALLAPAGIQLQWLDAAQASSAAQTKLLSVELRGSCQPVWSSTGVFKEHSALASTAVVDGKVLPFSWIDCTALNQFLGPNLSRDSESERNRVFGRAMARVLAHEFYHMLLETQEHTRAGLSKAQFSISDLLAERLVFEPSVQARLRPQAPVQRASAPLTLEPVALEEDDPFAAR